MDGSDDLGLGAVGDGAVGETLVGGDPQTAAVEEPVVRVNLDASRAHFHRPRWSG